MRASSPDPAVAASRPPTPPPAAEIVERTSDQITAVALPVASAARTRRPTDPEIETYLEIEADEPPESGVDVDLESELALSIAFSGDLDRVPEPISTRFEDGDTLETEVMTEAMTEAVTEAMTEAVTEVMTEPVTEVMTEAVTEVVAETEPNAHPLTVTVTEPGLDRAPVRKRAITAQDAASVSGTISIPDDGSAPPRRAKRQSDGWDE
jgi:hypothetical protein